MMNRIEYCALAFAAVLSTGWSSCDAKVAVWSPSGEQCSYETTKYVIEEVGNASGVRVVPAASGTYDVILDLTCTDDPEPHMTLTARSGAETSTATISGIGPDARLSDTGKEKVRESLKTLTKEF